MTLEHGRSPRQSLDAYDAVPRWVQALGIPFGAKLLYGALRTAQNTRWEPSYEQLAEHCHASVRSIVRWVKILANLTLIAVKRRGQGRTNQFAVLDRGTSESDAEARAATTPSQTRSEAPSYKKRIGIGIRGRFNTPNSGTCYGCGGPHPTQACQKYAGQIKT